MMRQIYATFALVVIAGVNFPQARAAETPVLTPVATFNGVQVTGITVSDEGRIFATFPRWREGVPFSVVEIMKDGSSKPYPDQAWNTWRGEPERDRFVSVQSVVAHGDSLYVLDPASPNMTGVVGYAKLYEFNLKNDRLIRTLLFPPQIAPEKSYLNDMRIDGHMMYVTDSGLGAIIVLDLKEKTAMRRLSAHDSTKSEDVVLNVEGQALLRDGKPLRIDSDGIELRDGFLYYHALTAYTLYRVPVAALNDNTLPESKVIAQIENLGKTPAPDGMIFDDAGNLYMADLESNAIVYRTPEGKIRTLVKDPLIKWADTFAIDHASGKLLFTTSRIHEALPGQPVT
ncbi:MAG: L-dopachrome tautomerase-related protein, partial [Bdellovibrionota bacterium]